MAQDIHADYDFVTTKEDRSRDMEFAGVVVGAFVGSLDSRFYSTPKCRCYPDSNLNPITFKDLNKTNPLMDIENSQILNEVGRQRTLE